MKAASRAVGLPDHRVFLPATACSGVGINEYYKSDEEYFHALAAELNKDSSSPWHDAVNTGGISTSTPGSKRRITMRTFQGAIKTLISGISNSLDNFDFLYDRTTRKYLIAYESTDGLKVQSFNQQLILLSTVSATAMLSTTMSNIRCS